MPSYPSARNPGDCMLHVFLSNNRTELIDQCRAKVSKRVQRHATDLQLRNGVPLFIDQLIRTLVAEDAGNEALSIRVSGPSGGDVQHPSEIGVAAIAHGKSLLGLGFTVDQVVHDYGDLCQAITQLAEQRDAPFRVEEFRTLNRCLDNAIADSVSAFSAQRDTANADRLSDEANERLAFLSHELRNALHTASLSVRALELGGLTLGGATGAVLKRSLASMRALIDASLGEVRARSAVPVPRTTFSLAAFVTDAGTTAQLEADIRGCDLLVSNVDSSLRIEANRDLLLAALGNLLSNAFKFTHRGTTVRLTAHAVDERIFVEIADHCGGLAVNQAEEMFEPFTQQGIDRTGLGLGLSIARHNVESMGGLLTVKNLPDVGCVFTISFPRAPMAHRADKIVD